MRIFVFPRNNGINGTHSERAHFVRRDNRHEIESTPRNFRTIFSAAVSQSMRVETGAVQGDFCDAERTHKKVGSVSVKCTQDRVFIRRKWKSKVFSLSPSHHFIVSDFY